MPLDGFNPHSDPVARHLHDATTELRGLRQELWEAHQPPGVQAALQAERDAQGRAMLWGVRLVLGGLAGYWLVGAVFGRVGVRVLGGALSFVWNAFEVVFVLGAFVLAARALWRGVRWLVRRSDAGGVGGDR